jgi:hypothetical protein
LDNSSVSLKGASTEITATIFGRFVRFIESASTEITASNFSSLWGLSEEFGSRKFGDAWVSARNCFVHLSFFSFISRTKEMLMPRWVSKREPQFIFTTDSSWTRLICTRQEYSSTQQQTHILKIGSSQDFSERRSEILDAINTKTLAKKKKKRQNRKNQLSITISGRLNLVNIITANIN